MTIAYKKNDVWLVEFDGNIGRHRILKVEGHYLLWTYGWITGEEFHARAKHRIGRARMFLGIQFGIIRD